MYNDGTVNRQSFKTAYPELFAEIEAEGYGRGFLAGKRALSTSTTSPPLPSPPPAQPSPGGIDRNLPLEERCKEEWRHSPNLREEFHDKFDSFIAFKKAMEAGCVRIFQKAGGNKP